MIQPDERAARQCFCPVATDRRIPGESHACKTSHSGYCHHRWLHWLMALEGQLRGSGGVLHWLAIVVVAVATFLANYLCHEWGHLLGARLAGGTCHPANKLKTFYLFHFDTRYCSVRQFLAMAAGGLVASTILLAFWLVALPLDTAAGIAAISLIVLGYLATLATELPVVWRIAHGAPLPKGALFEPMT
jgi:hypothetical protein